MTKRWIGYVLHATFTKQFKSIDLIIEFEFLKLYFSHFFFFVETSSEKCECFWEINFSTKHEIYSYTGLSKYCIA